MVQLYRKVGSFCRLFKYVKGLIEIMARYRETVCKYYVALGECKKGRDASHEHYCQHCNKYEPRARVRHINQKKRKLEEIRRKERY